MQGQDMSDKEFDELFKRKVENYDIPYNPKAWNRMQAKLNRAEGIGGSNLRKFITGLALLILLGVGSFWYTGVSKTTSSQETKTQNTPASKQAGKQEVSSEVPPQKRTAYNRNKEAGVKPSSVASNKDIVQKRISAGSVSTTTRKVNSSVSEENGLAAFAEEQQEPLMDEKIVYQHENLSYLPSQLWTPLAVARISDSISIKKVAVNQPALPSSENPEEDKKENAVIPGSSPFYRVGLSFTLSPDLSAIGLKDISQVGTKSGVGLEYFLFRNVSLNTGVIFSHKIYSATEGYEFAWEQGYNSPKPSSIDAECNVLDLALNLRYYALNWKKSRIYLSSGLSSYLMLSEAYKYRYDSYYTHNNASYRIKNENQHYFKVSNFSIGYERALGNRWALQAEPFVKIPIAGVGAGKVKLSTAGMFVTLNYRFGLTRLYKK